MTKVWLVTPLSVAVTFDVPEDSVAGQADPQRFVMSAGQEDSVAGALAAGQSAAPLAVAPPHQQTEWQVAAGAGGGGAARLQEGGELSAGRLVPPGQQPRGALPRCEY